MGGAGLCGQARSIGTGTPLTLDQYFSFVEITSARLSPDGTAAVIGTSRADWDHNRFRDDLWLWREGHDGLIPLAQSGHDSNPEWSPDGRYIAFLSDRASDAPNAEPAEGSKEIQRVWIVSAAAGEPFPLYSEPLKTHNFAWNQDGTAILFSTTEPLSKSTEEAEKREWKDVSRWRDQERGDLLLEIPLRDASPKPGPIVNGSKREQAALPLPEHARVITKSTYAIQEIAPAPTGGVIAFLTGSVSGRLEHPEAYEIYVVTPGAAETQARQLTHNEGLERQLRWNKAGTELYFGVYAESGSVEGKYAAVQGRLYAVDVASGKLQRLGSDFGGNWTDFALTNQGNLIGLGQLATEVQVYTIDGGKANKLKGHSGSYEGLHTPERSPRVLFRHSGIDEPTELFLAADAGHLASARQLTHFNDLFAEHFMPQWKTYHWTADDGAPVEGVLMYPPGKLGQQHLRMLTLIHGGPSDADGNRFGADWYNWAELAAANGWLVFQPNYRGSSGYGDAFLSGLIPHLVSRPGKDILEGVDALVKDGIADPDHLAIGGYSYGGYMTNWLITQTTRFRSAVSGAGAVEHAANWGNDDETFDDAFYLGGRPWEAPEMYQQEAALFQFNKVRTPVHDVIGADDIRVSASQGYLIERALDALGIPHAFLIFPGEGHSLGNNPWHGYIKVREELKWLEKYDRGTTAAAGGR